MTNDNQNDQSNTAQQDAARQVEEAMKILPKKHFLGCRRSCLKNVSIGILIVLVLGWWMLFRSVKPKISKETTYITEPLTEDGKRVDYYKATEQLIYPPEMKTDENGYRVMLAALGHQIAEIPTMDPKSADAIEYMTPLYEAVGLPGDTQPTMKYQDSRDWLYEKVGLDKTEKELGMDKLPPEERDALREERAAQREKFEVIYDKVMHSPWTLDDVQEMEGWIESVDPVLDMLAEEVNKPVFALPMAQSDDKILIATLLPCHQAVRNFARSLQARAYYRIATGDIDGAIDDVITCKRLGRHIEHSGFLIGALVGIAIDGIAESIDINGSPEHPATAEQLQRLAESIKDLPPHVTFEDVMISERLMSLDAIQAMAWGNVPLSELSGSYGPSPPGLIGFDWNLVMRQTNDCFDDHESFEKAHMNRRSIAKMVCSIPFPKARSLLLADTLMGLLLPATDAAHEAFHRIECAENMKAITLAMLIYEREHGTLPPAWTVDSQGNPLHSWRVLLLPYLGEQELYDKIRLDQPWDSEYNTQFHDAVLDIYQCESNTNIEPGETGYTVIIGDNTAFSGDGQGKKLDEFGPNRRNLILIAERVQPVCWMDPTLELTEEVAMKGVSRIPENRCINDMTGWSSMHSGGLNAGFAGGGMRYLSETTEPEKLQGMLDGTAETRE